MDYLFQAEQVSKSYTGHKALSNVSLKIPAGTIFGLLGPNGAGKTTLIRIINQIIAPDEGTLYYRNEKMNPDHARRIGYLPEERGLYKKMKVGEQAVYLAQLKGVPEQKAKKLLREWFEKFDLLRWWGKKVEELSKGMAQKVQFIITVLHKPDLLIFDEPFSGFDPINVNLIKQEILKLREEGATIIFSTHNMASVEELCDNIALINKSEKILDGNVREIKKDYSTNMFQLELAQLQKPVEQLFDHRFELINTIPHNGLVSTRVKIVGNASSNDLLKQAIAASTLVSFNELMPTMNDIFIKTVTGKFPQESNENEMPAGANSYLSE
ncbi:MAG TPA: ATP-binding cassette domain-containing protein [Bacteroidales bacterium]|nr:ATP-binding cassette domain-containing protein [Bacteroidales bacterium]